MTSPVSAVKINFTNSTIECRGEDDDLDTVCNFTTALMQVNHPYPKFVLVVESSDGFEVAGVDLN